MLVERKENSRKQHQHLVNLIQCCLIWRTCWKEERDVQCLAQWPLNKKHRHLSHPVAIFLICHFRGSFSIYCSKSRIKHFIAHVKSGSSMNPEHILPPPVIFFNICACFTVICGRIVLSVLVKLCASRHSTAVGNPPEI